MSKGSSKGMSEGMSQDLPQGIPKVHPNGAEFDGLDLWGLQVVLGQILRKYEQGQNRALLLLTIN